MRGKTFPFYNGGASGGAKYSIGGPGPPHSYATDGGEVVIDWLVWICNLEWEQSRVPEAWSKAIIVPLYKGKGNREECNNYRGISLLSVPGKIYGRILNERMIKITDKRVGAEQGGFRKGRGCVDQIFAVKINVEKYLEKDIKLFAAFMDLEKAYDRADRKALWDTLSVWGGRAVA